MDSLTEQALAELKPLSKADLEDVLKVVGGQFNAVYDLVDATEHPAFTVAAIAYVLTAAFTTYPDTLPWFHKLMISLEPWYADLCVRAAAAEPEYWAKCVAEGGPIVIHPRMSGEFPAVTEN